MRRPLTTAFLAATFACAAATAASADPLSALLGSLFGAPEQSNARYYQPAATSAYAYAPAGSGYATGGYMAEPERPAASAIRREMVAFDANYAPGTVVISTSERRLYLVLPGQRAIKYGIGVGREGFAWSGTQTITRKQEWPDWVPPAEMLKRRPDLPRYMPGGIENPLGARAMYLGGTLYRIHGSNEPETIGTAVSSGCIRMLNEDVVDLYQRVKVGTKVVVLR
jgi:lipoprotein-anchoring transpeptidase ErfK/SrfK